MSFRVVQTVSAFHYPEGKIWGPYVEQLDANDRVALLREFGAPCGMNLVGAGGGGGLLAAA